MADDIADLLTSVRGFVPALVVGVIAGAMASSLGASNLVAGFVGLAAFLVTFVGVNVWHMSGARARLVEKHPRAGFYIFLALLAGMGLAWHLLKAMR